MTTERNGTLAKRGPAETPRAQRPSIEYVEQAIQDIDGARRGAGAELRKTLDSALERLRDAVGDLRERGDDQVTVGDDGNASRADASEARHVRPRLSRGPMVVRERLIRAMGGQDVPLRVLVAPAGYGKTTLLEQWAEHDPRPFAWVTVERGHHDPVRLLTEVVQALDAIEPVDDAVLAALMAPQPAITTIAMPRLARALASRAIPFVLVVDQVELLEGEDAKEVVGALAGLMAPGCTLALAARCEALPLGGRRSRGEVIELHARELAMTRREAGELLRTAGLDLDADQVAWLVSRTEGWPAALHLAALALRDEEDVAEALARFAGDDRLVADYLRDELLSRAPAAEVTFLMRISPLDELSGPLCDAALGVHGSGAVLRGLSRSNLLITPLDRSDEHFRCHRCSRTPFVPSCAGSSQNARWRSIAAPASGTTNAATSIARSSTRSPPVTPGTPDG
jgi:ATP/maltotriose-dependent transcriptional regulator MalT